MYRNGTLVVISAVTAVTTNVAAVVGGIAAAMRFARGSRVTGLPSVPVAARPT